MFPRNVTPWHLLSNLNLVRLKNRTENHPMQVEYVDILFEIFKKD